MDSLLSIDILYCGKPSSSPKARPLKVSDSLECSGICTRQYVGASLGMRNLDSIRLEILVGLFFHLPYY
jgi:hypothetical protein